MPPSSLTSSEFGRGDKSGGIEVLERERGKVALHQQCVRPGASAPEVHQHRASPSTSEILIFLAPQLFWPRHLAGAWIPSLAAGRRPGMF